MSSAALLLACFLSAPVERSTPAIEMSVFAARPASLSAGQLLGPSLSASWLFEELELGLRLGLGWVSENDPAWRVVHTELHSTARAAWVHRIGRGELSLGAGLGLITLAESRTRHQSERLAASGLPLSTSGWSAGPELSLQAGVRLALVGDFALVLDGGPSLSWLPGASEVGVRLGWSGSLGVAYVWPQE